MPTSPRPASKPSSRGESLTTLPSSYTATFERMLGQVAGAARDPDLPLVPFWPLRGARYDDELLVVGPSVNGWIADWTSRQLRDQNVRREAVARLRQDAEAGDRDRMAWVTDLWGSTSGYSTRRSAFWRVLRRLHGSDADSDWPSYLVWTNLYKVSPASGWNPGADLQRAQRADACELLGLELEAFAPRRVLALTGNWIAPFAEGLNLTLDARPGLVEHAGSGAGRAWVVAKHPMGKPEDRFVAEVMDAFADLGAPLTAHSQRA